MPLGVVDLENEGREVLGLFVRQEEDAVAYNEWTTGLLEWAPADCVEVVIVCQQGDRLVEYWRPDPLAGIASVRAELVAEAQRQERLDTIAPATAPEYCRCGAHVAGTPCYLGEAGGVEPRALLVAGAVLLAAAVGYLLLPYLVGAGVIFAAYRHLTRGTRRRRPRSSWSSLGRTAALMFAAYNSRWLKPASVQRNGRPLRVSVPASADGEPNPYEFGEVPF